MSPGPRRQQLVIIIAGIIAIGAAAFFVITFNDMDMDGIGTSITSNSLETLPTSEEVDATTPTVPEQTPKIAPSQKAPALSNTGNIGKLGAIVTYTNNGFEPTRATVAKGQMVHFINQSDRKLWVGSADHPTHANYPERELTDCFGSSFDQCKAVGTGESWDFTFNATGEWDYHNHMRARDIGTVIVTE